MDFIFNPFNLLFGFGIIAAIINDKLPHSFKFWMFYTGNILFAMIGIWHSYIKAFNGFSLEAILLFGLASFLIIAACNTESVERLFQKKNLLYIIGNASYSVYLIHFPVLSFLCKIFRVINIENIYGFKNIIFPTLASLTLCIGIAFHYLVEVPALNLLRNKWLQKPQTWKTTP